MPVGVRITIDTSPLKRFGGAIDLSSGQSPVMSRMFDQVGAIYSAFVRRRFVANSRGGGGWAPLAAATVRRRRKGSGSGVPAILRDSGLLFRALTIRGPGNHYQKIPNGIVYGFGPSPHPRRILVQKISKTARGGRIDRRGKPFAALTAGKANLQQIAAWHNEGTGRLPRRVILAAPDPATIAQFNGAVRRAVTEAGALAASGPGVNTGGGKP